MWLSNFFLFCSRSSKYIEEFENCIWTESQQYWLGQSIAKVIQNPFDFFLCKYQKYFIRYPLWFFVFSWINKSLQGNIYVKRIVFKEGTSMSSTVTLRYVMFCYITLSYLMSCCVILCGSNYLASYDPVKSHFSAKWLSVTSSHSTRSSPQPPWRCSTLVPSPVS